jgi:hypothetical protein
VAGAEQNPAQQAEAQPKRIQVSQANQAKKTKKKSIMK